MPYFQMFMTIKKVYKNKKNPWGKRHDYNNEEDKQTASCRTINVSSANLSDAVPH